MIFTPKQLGSTALDKATLSVDKKFCKRFGPCGVGDEAIYLNSFFFDRVYYAALKSVKRIFKRVAMSKGGFTGKGVFGAIPYLVVELDDGTVKQCNFKYEQDVDLLLAHISKIRPDLPTHSLEAEKRLKEKQAAMEAKFLKELTPKAQKALGWNAAQVMSAFAHLCELGLAEDNTPPERKNAPRPEDCPAYTTEDITAELTDKNSDFKSLLEEVEHLLGKKCSVTEVRILLELFDNLAMPAEELKNILTPFGKPVTACASVSQGVEEALRQAGPQGLVLAFGSLYMVGDVRKTVLGA